MAAKNLAFLLLKENVIAGNVNLPSVLRKHSQGNSDVYFS